jgi:hypothetical protein
LAIIRSGEAEPAPETYRTALRDVIRHCLYAVDKNPLAVDLCKVALWIEGHSPGLPLSFLDHRIRCGDSLIGVFDLDVLKAGVPDSAFKRLTDDDPAVCSELRRINRRDRGGELAKFSAEAILAELAAEFAALADMPDETPGDVRSKEELYRQLKESERVARLRNACDAWTAAFFASRGSGHEHTAPTTADVWSALNGQPNHQRAAIIDELSDRFRCFHWRLEFPEVFARGGFDVMLGNPPWERIKLQEQEFFAVHDPDIAMAPNKAAREELIRALFAVDADSAKRALGEAFVAAKRETEAESLFARVGQRFPLTATGDINTYALFAELAASLVRAAGQAGIIVPTGISTDDTTKRFFEKISTEGRLASLFSFENEEFIFKSVHHSFRFCLLRLRGAPEADSASEFLFFARKPSDLLSRDRRFTLTPAEISRINPNTKTAPIFRSHADAELTKRIYDRVPVLIDDNKGAAGNQWGIEFLRMFDMANDSRLFRTARQLEKDGLRRDGSDWIGTENERWVPLYEAKMIHHYDHRWATYYIAATGEDETQQPSPAEKAHPGFTVSARYWVPRAEVEARLAAKGWHRQWLMGWRDITSAHVLRTVIASAVPRAGCGDTLLLMFPSVDSRLALPGVLLACLTSLPADYVARQKVSWTHLKCVTFKQLAVLSPSAFGADELRFVLPRVLELTYTAHDMRPFAQDLGYDGPPFPWDPDRRALLKAELDGYFAYLYGLSRDELRYILDPKEVMGPDYPSETFRVLKENECRAFREYRTRRLVLEAWDRFAEDGTFDPARLRDPTHFDAVQRALVETRGRVKSLERELKELLARSDAAPLPTLFVEGESDVAILTAAWQAFYPTEPLPVTILAAGGTRQMESLAGRGAALRQLLGDRLVFALADNDRAGRALVEDGRTRRGGTWRQQSNGIHWCLLAPTAEFEQAMKRFGIPDNFWPFTIESAFPVALRRQAMAEGAYAVEEATVQAAFLEDPATSNKALRAAHQLGQAGDDALLYFRPPHPDRKLAFGEWIAAPERRDRTTFAAFGPILERLQHAISSASENNDSPPKTGVRLL